MAAVATIKNPLSPKETLIFFCTDDLHVGLHVQGEGPNDLPHPAPGRGGDPGSSDASVAAAGDDSGAAGDAPSTKGVLINPSSFGTLRYKDLVLVCGIRRDNKICLVSPGFTPLPGAPVPKGQSLAACGDGADHGWLYCISKDPAELREYSFSTRSPATVQGAQPNANSYLCAYYENSRRYCIYQGNGNSLYVVERPGGTVSKISNTGNAKPKTPMAVTNTGVNAQLYYSDSSNNLVRISRNAAGWQSSAIVENAPPLADATQLAALTSSNGLNNLLYYIVEDGEGRYQRYIDKV